MLLLLGEEDDIAPPSVCESLVERLADSGNVSMRRYPGARHGFDNPELPALLAIGGGFTLGFDSQAAANAWDEIDEFLTR